MIDFALLNQRDFSTTWIFKLRNTMFNNNRLRQSKWYQILCNSTFNKLYKEPSTLSWRMLWLRPRLMSWQHWVGQPKWPISQCVEASGSVSLPTSCWVISETSQPDFCLYSSPGDSAPVPAPRWSREGSSTWQICTREQFRKQGLWKLECNERPLEMR